eukprot:TRINITY_DN13425_c0_g1_i1.p1 TRINITY_DN13425_c0_g1~~TRINITY_DN13425_c0_g1_i1.p1  ORF type:complete len:505 (+),score=209.79 TRINITY_DN13425_c0_g1_i1:69-1517(+)
MSEETWEVTLRVYDLLGSMGPQAAMMRTMAQRLFPSFEGIWHTGIVVYGFEYFYSGGIQKVPMNQPLVYGTPTKVITLGVTSVGMDLFDSWVQEISDQFSPNNYNLINNNCNHFTNEASQFLTGSLIPDFVRLLPQQLLNTPMGQMLRPMIERAASSFSAGTSPDLDSIAALTGLGANAFGQGPSAPGSGFSPASGSSSAAPVGVSAKKELVFKVLDVKQKLPSLFSSSANEEKIFLKLAEFAEGIWTDSEKQSFKSLEVYVTNRKSLSKYAIQQEAFSTIRRLGRELPVERLFPLVDIVRLTVLNFGANEVFAAPPTIDLLMEWLDRLVISPSPSVPDASKYLCLRVFVNMFGHPHGANALVHPFRLPKIVEAILKGLESDTKQLKHTVATLAYNCAVFLPNDFDQTIELLSAVTHSLSQLGNDSDETAFALLMSLGRLIFDNEDAISTAKDLSVNLEPFKRSSLEKVRSVASDVEAILLS